MSRATSPGFPTTHWSKVARAGMADGEAQREALGELLRLYLKPLRAYLRRNWKLGADDADDALQGFIAGKIMEDALIGHADRLRGKFRTFLLAALDRFVTDEFRRKQAIKRGAGRVKPLEASDRLARSHPSPDEAFDLAWARQVLVHAAQRMREQCNASGRNEVWGVFDGRVLGPTLHGTEPIAYEKIVPQFGLASAQEASNVLVTAKRMFTRALRSVVREYLREDVEIEAEVADLRRILAKGTK